MLSGTSLTVIVIALLVAAGIAIILFALLPTNQRTCPHCGNTESAHANYCGRCGRPLNSANPPTPRE